MRHLLRVHTENCFTKCGINQMGIFLETIAVHHIINSRNGRAFINPIQHGGQELSITLFNFKKHWN